MFNCSALHPFRGSFKFTTICLQQEQAQVDRQVGIADATDNDVLPETSLETSVMPLNPSDSALDETEELAPLQAIVEEASLSESHSQDAADDERNREYLIRRAALRDNPTQEQMDAVVAYGLEQHRINFPHLYQ